MNHIIGNLNCKNVKLQKMSIYSCIKSSDMSKNSENEQNDCHIAAENYLFLLCSNRHQQKKKKDPFFWILQKRFVPKKMKTLHLPMGFLNLF